MINLNLFSTDPKAEAEGREFTLRCGMKVRLARANSPAHQEKIRVLLEPYSQLIRAKQPLPSGVSDDVSIKAMAITIILGWGPVEYNGATFEYSPENAEILLRDPTLHDLQDEITALSGAAASFRQKQLEDAEKN